MKKCSKFTRALALLLVAVMSLSACSQGGTSSQSGTTSQGSNADPVAHDNDIVVAVAADISGFDPTALSSLYNQTVLWQMYDRLYELDEEKKPVPHLAKEAEMVSDNRVGDLPGGGGQVQRRERCDGQRRQGLFGPRHCLRPGWRDLCPAPECGSGG